MKIAAPSKINLYLRICGTLPNGYHEIETLFVPLADPCDELDIEFIDDGRGDIHVSSDVPLPAEQLGEPSRFTREPTQSR